MHPAGTVLVVGLVLVAACSDGPSQPSRAPLAIAGGAGQSGTATYPLADSIAVRVTDDAGAPVPGVAVTFVAGSGGATSPVVDTTGADGMAYTQWTLGLATGSQSLQISASGFDPASAHATATAFTAGRIGSGAGPTACALSGGTAYCWSSGATPTAIAGGPYSEIAVGGEYACALTASGTPWCWSVRDSTTPAAVAGAPALHALTMASMVNGEAACALATDGAAWCWGEVPLAGGIVQTAAAVDAAPGSHFAVIGVGQDVLCGVDSPGVGYCWGTNRTNSLGLGAAAADSYYGAPQPLATTVHFSTIANSGYGGCATGTDGNTYCWGDSNGEPGGDYTTVRQFPGLRAVSYSMGFQTSTVLAGGHGAWWGTAPSQDLGSEPLATVSAANLDDSGIALTSFSGTSYPCGVATNGMAYCWSYGGVPGADGHWTVHAIPAP